MNPVEKGTNFTEDGTIWTVAAVLNSLHCLIQREVSRTPATETEPEKVVTAYSVRLLSTVQTLINPPPTNPPA